MEKLTPERIQQLIYILRGQRVMLDSDLAKLYGVETSYFNRQVRRNIERFPEDFMFQITSEELKNLLCQNGTASSRHGGKRNPPLVFTENGVAMLSSVINSPKGIQVNIAIMRIFTRLRSYLLLEQDLKDEFKLMKSDTNKLFRIIFERLDSIEETLEPRLSPKRKKIGLKS